MKCGEKKAALFRTLLFVILALQIGLKDANSSCGESDTEVGYGDVPAIGHIDIQRVHIFDISKEEENKPIFRFVNALHFLTKEDVIRRELLFKEGDKLDEELLKESERNLRSLEIFRQVEIRKKQRNGIYDISVKTQDTWTTAILFGIGGINRLRLTLAGLEEKNLMGYDKQLSLRYNRTEEREYYTFSYNDPRTLGYFLNLNAMYSRLSDGRTSSLSLIRPFYSLGTTWSAGISGSEQKLNIPIYREGEKDYELKNRGRHLELFISRLVYYEGDLLYRIKGFYKFDRDLFSPKGSVSLENIPKDRKASAPGVGLQRIRADYVKADHINKFEREEDFNLGSELNASVGFSSESFGSIDDELIFNGSYLFGFRSWHTSFGVGSFSLNFRNWGSDIRNALGSIDLRYFERSLPRQTLIFHLNITKGWDLDKDVQLTLGSDSGLRGYHSNQFTGEKKVLFNIEDRIFIKDDFLHLVSIGLASFFDMGYVWKRGETVDFSDLKASIGIGLRFGFTRSSVGTVTRLDLSYALNNPGAGRDRWVFMVSTLPPF